VRNRGSNGAHEAIVITAGKALTRRAANDGTEFGELVMKNELSNLLTPDQVAAHTGISMETLAQWRSQKRGIPYLKIGRSVRYDPQDVQQYLAGCRVSVSDPNERRWK